MVAVAAIAITAFLRTDVDLARAADDAVPTAEPSSCQCACPGADVTMPEDAPPTDTGSGDADQITPPTDATDGGSATEPVAPTTTHIVFSELLPDPEGKDTDGEFVEMRNAGNRDVSLAGWAIRTSSEKIFKFADVTMPAGSYRYFLYSETKLTLTNTGGDLSLIDPNGRGVDHVTYPGPAKTGQSYAKKDDGLWQWTPLLTPGAANEFPPAVTPDPAPPPAEENPDASSGTENTSDNNPSENVGEPVADATPTTPTDNSGTAAEDGAATPTDGAASGPGATAIPHVVISEFLPNPTGDDSTEWIELANIGGSAADLSGWSIDDDPGGSKAFVLTAAEVIDAGGWLLLPKSRTGLALNNDGDSVRLSDTSGALVDAVAYASAAEGRSYVLTQTGWVWTDKPTPGAANEAGIIDNQAKNPAVAALTSGDVDDSGQNAPEEITPVEIGDLSELDDGQTVTIRGVVNLPPGRLGKTMFSLQDAADAAGVIVRLYGKALPAMAVGDIWEIAGKIAHAGDEIRVNASAAAAKKTGEQTLKFSERTVTEIGPEDNGVAVAVTGLVAGHGKNWLTLTDPAGESEIKITLPKGASLGPSETGSEATARGVVRFHETGPELVLMDRKALKVAVPSPEKTAETETAGSDTAAGAPARTPQIFSEISPDRSGSVMALVLALLAAAAAVGYFWWRRQRVCDGLAE